MTHPLTEEMMDQIHGDEPGYSNPFDEDDMRAAYDKGYADAYEDIQDLLTCLQRKGSTQQPVTLEELEAMIPQQQEDN